MTAYKTGRSRTLTISGTISGKAWGASSGHPPVLTGNKYALEIAANWITDNATKVTALATSLGLEVTAETGLGDSDSDSDSHVRTSSTTVTGSYSISIDLEEWIEVTESASPPTFGGTPDAGDMPGETLVQFTERYKIGGDLTATITLTDGTYSVTATATDALSSATIFTRYDWSGWLNAEGLFSAQTASVTWDYHEFDVPAYSKSGGGATISAGSEQASVAVDSSSDPVGTIRWNGIPPQGFVLEGRLRADNAAYTSDCLVRVKRKNGETYGELTPVGGSYSSASTQETCSVWGDCDGVAQDSVAKDEHTSVLYHWLVPPVGENADQWRLMLRGAYYDAGTIVQAATLALDGGFSFGDTGTTRTWSPEKSLAGYRYLLLATDQAAKDVTLTIGSKSWTGTTGASGLVAFDLCRPHNLATDTDERDSRWPIPTAVDVVDADGCMWGVVNVGSLTLTAETGVTCVVAANGVYLSRDTWTLDPVGHSLLNVVAPHLYWVPSGVANTYKRPLLRGDTDGRRSLDEADWTRVVGTPTIYTARTIKNLFDDVNASDSSVVRNPGWTAVIDTDIDVADGASGTDWEYNLLNRNRNASWIEGSGIAYVAGAWRYALDVDVSSAYTLIAQMLVDKVAIYPMCGDVFGLRTGANRWEYGTTVEQGRAELRAGRYMRSAAWGLTLHENGIAHSGATVTQKELPDLTAAGSGNSDIRGEYLTGTPWGRAGYDHRIQPQVGAGATYIDRMLYGGTRLRSCFTAVPGSLGAIEADGPRAWLHVGYGKRVRTYNLWGWDIVQESDEYAVDSWLKLRTDPRRGSLHMLSDDGGGTIGVWASYDGGMTGTEVATVTATSAAIEVDSERGVYVCLYENGGNVQVQQSGDAGGTWTAATDALYLGAAFAGTVIDMARDARRDVLLLALESGGVISIYGSQDLGLTWELVAS